MMAGAYLMAAEHTVALLERPEVAAAWAEASALPEMTVGGLAGRADRDPAHRALSDIGADLEAEDVAIEGQRGVRVVMREDARVNGDVHARQASCGSMTGAS